MPSFSADSGDAAASSFDGCLGTCGRADARQLDRLGEFAALDDLDHLGQLAHQTGLLQCQNVPSARPSWSRAASVTSR